MSSDEDSAATAELQRVASVRAKLPEWQRAAVLKARAAGMSWERIAAAAGVKVRAVQDWAKP